MLDSMFARMAVLELQRLEKQWKAYMQERFLFSGEIEEWYTQWGVLSQEDKLFILRRDVPKYLQRGLGSSYEF